jgi:hypothetical protein
MGKALAAGCCLTCIFVVWGSVAGAQEEPGADFDYDALVEELPIESEVFGPSLTFTNRNGGVTTIYGQFNFAYQSFDDGEETTDGVVDNGNWNSRLGITYTQPLDEVTFRARFESGFGLRNSALVSQEFTPDWIDWQRTALRWFEVAADTNYGTISLGQGSTATDVTVGAVNSNFNGARRFRARYDTPVYYGFMASTSYGQNILTEGDNTDYYDVALRWTGDIGDFAVRTAVGYQWLDDPDADDTRRLAGSATAVHTPTGLNLSVSAGEQIDGASYFWVRAGLRRDFFDVGTTSLSVDYYSGYDFLSNGARTENYGIYAVQTFDEASVDIYAGVRMFTYSDNLGGSYQDAYGVLTGARFAF